ADIRAAQIVSAVYGAQGVKVPLNEAILQWEVVPANNIKDPFTAFENALFAATQ
ncbi:phage tail protein, partial [Escherichia coli]